MDGSTREAVAIRRLRSVLKAHGAAVARTLEQKIADAGPGGQRIDPHVLTRVRNKLVETHILGSTMSAGVAWYHLFTAPTAHVAARIAQQEIIHQALSHPTIAPRVGQTLEIAVYRALCTQNTLQHFGAFTDLDAHDDSTLYAKEEPPAAISGKAIPGKRRLDFVVIHPQAGAGGVEVKNVREWLYPDRDEIKEMLAKCCAVDAIPILIARRIPFVTFKVLNTAGVIVHQTYNQLLPASESVLAAQAKDKTLLGYHDIKTGNIPDQRLVKFITVNLPKLMPAFRHVFRQYQDLLYAYGTREIQYDEFAARVRRRSSGMNEDSDLDPDFYPE